MPAAVSPAVTGQRWRNNKEALAGQLAAWSCTLACSHNASQSLDRSHLLPSAFAAARQAVGTRVEHVRGIDPASGGGARQHAEIKGKPHRRQTHRPTVAKRVCRGVQTDLAKRVHRSLGS